MKKRIKGILLVFLIMILATSAVYAGNSIINAMISTKDGLTMIPYDANNTEITSSGSILNPEYFKVTYENENIQEGEQYTIFVVAADLSGTDPVYEVNEGSVKYIDQTAGAAGSVVFEKVYPSEICDAVVLIAGLGLDSPELVATVKADISSTASVTFENKTEGGVAPATVTPAENGTDFTVTCEKACFVIQANKDGSYTKLEAAQTDVENTYAFSANVEDGDATVLIVLKGDVNQDGKIKGNDSTQTKAVVLEYITPNELQKQLMDVSGDGKIKGNDATQIKAVALEKIEFSW